MKLHIVRHAEAVDQLSTIPDDYRYLTCRGRTRFRRVADTLKKCGIDPDIIVSSPLVRAVQTAEILAETIRFAGELTILPMLAGSFSLPRLKEYLESIAPVRELVMVGHEPDLGLVVGELLDHTPCTLKKGGVVSLKIKLQQPEIATNFLWLVTGGGRLITNHDAAMARITGGHAQPEEA
jgi:phosphohistidine phosphatase